MQAGNGFPAGAVCAMLRGRADGAAWAPRSAPAAALGVAMLCASASAYPLRWPAVALQSSLRSAWADWPPCARPRTASRHSLWRRPRWPSPPRPAGSLSVQAGTDAGRPLPQQQIIAAEDVVAVYRLEEDGDASGCGVVETETEAPEGIEEEEAMAFDASRAVFRAFTFEDGHEVVIREVQYHMLGYGHTVWEAAIALGAWLRQPRQARLLRDKRVLELGCGCALPGLAAAQGGADVTLSDMGDAGGDGQDAQPWELLANARYNAAANSVGAGAGACPARPRVVRIDWGDALATPDYAARADTFPVIIGSDLLYEEKAIAPLVAAICAHLTPEGIFVMMAPASPDLSRTRLVEGFVEALRATGGSVSVSRCSLVAACRFPADVEGTGGAAPGSSVPCDALDAAGGPCDASGDSGILSTDALQRIEFALPR